MFCLHLRVYDSVKNLDRYQEFLRLFSKGSALTSTRICPRTTTKGSETAQRCYRRRSWERKRFRSFTTFSVFVRSKAKGKGILMRPVLPLFVSFSRRRSSTRRAPETLHGPWSFISRASDTRASHSPLAHPPKCARILHVHAYTSHLFSLHGGWVEVTRTAPAGFLKDKGVTSLPEIAELVVPNKHTYCLSEKRNVYKNIITYRM